MVLYHVSFDTVTEKIFNPRIPTSKAFYEEPTIPRICFSDSISGCLQAIADVTDKILENDNQITVFKFEVDSNDRYLFSYTWLYDKGYVPDAEFTHEYWYCNSLKLYGVRYEVTAYDDDSYFLVHEFQRNRLFQYIEEHCNLPKEFIIELQKLSCSDILNVELYKELYWDYCIEPSEIAEFLHCSKLLILN